MSGMEISPVPEQSEAHGAADSAFAGTFVMIGRKDTV